MKIPLIGVALVLTSLSACTTVDLSQVALQTEPAKAVQADKNIVERASEKLTSNFREKGWCSGGPQEKTQTATSVLLNGVDTEMVSMRPTSIIALNARDLNFDLQFANQQVVQAAQAAALYLDMADLTAEVDSELSSLETALLSAREAEGRFATAVATYHSAENWDQFEKLKVSITTLKTVTDEYGERARSTIVANSSKSRS